MKNHNKVIMTSIIILSLFGGISHAQASNGSSVPANKKIEFGGICAGATHDPHPSSHAPGTINVTSETTCKNEHVSVQTNLYLGDKPKTWKFLVGSIALHLGTATTQTNFPCVVGRIYRVTAISLHSGEWGKVAWTGNSATVLCMKTIRPPLKVETKK